jgi:hypothetical protein
MRSHFQLLTAASVLALGLGLTAASAEPAAPGTTFLNAQNIPNAETVPDTDLAPGAYSDIIRVVDTVPSTGGVEKSAGGEGADNMNSADQPTSGAGSMSQGGPHSEDQGGTGVKGSAQSEGATNKSAAEVPATGAGSAQGGGASTGLEPGTGVEDSAQGEGATAKQGKPDMKEGKLPSDTSTY